VTRNNPHHPRPREGELPNGDLAVVGDRQLSNDGVTVPAADRPLHELLLDILWDEHVRDTMPARLAVACDDLVEVREAVMDIDRGSAEVGGRSYGLSYCHRVRDAIDAHRDREPRRFVAVGCSGSKYEDDDLLPARERYKGSYWSGKRRYGEAVAEPPTVNADRVRWRIISAEHAVLHPDTEIDYYECTPEDPRGVPIDSDQQLPNGDSVTTLLDRWALDVYEQLTEWICREAGSVDPRDVQLEVLLGRDYRDPLETRGVFDALRGPGAVTVSFPFQDEPDAQGGMINQIGWLNEQAEAAQTVATDGGERR